MSDRRTDKQIIDVIKEAARRAFESGMPVADALQMIRDEYEKAEKRKKSN